MSTSLFSHTNIVGKFIRLPLRIIPREMVVRILRGPLKGVKWVTGSSIHGCWLGNFEKDKQIILSKIIKKGTISYDIGANVGFYTLLFSKLVGDKGKVFSFEPLPRNLDYLNDHLKLNEISNVSLYDYAISDSTGEVFFDDSVDNSMGHITDRPSKLKVSTISLDELYEQGKIPLPNYIKIDVEGAEWLVLKGAKSILLESKPTIFLATHGSQIHKDCIDFLRSLGYKLIPIGTGSLEETDEIIAEFN